MTLLDVITVSDKGLSNDRVQRRPLSCLSPQGIQASNFIPDVGSNAERARYSLGEAFLILPT